MIQFLWLAVIGYAGLVILVAFFQRRLIYFPTRFSVSLAETIGGRSGFVAARAAGGEIIGWRLPSTNQTTASVLIFHGNGGCALDRDYLAAPICQAMPMDVLVVEYPGYGPREGAPNLPAILATTEAAIASLPADRAVYLVSESIGAGAAAHLAKKYPQRIRGMIMFVPYDDLGDVAQAAFPLLPAKWLLRDRFQPAVWLREYHGPIQFVLAGADEVIPTRRGQALHDGYAGSKRLQIVSGARHNDVTAQSPEWWREVFSFLEQHPPPAPK